jgi:hypothetical protein
MCRIRITGQLTSLEVEFDVCIFLLLGTVVVRASLDSECLSEHAIMIAEGVIAYTWTLRSSSSADGF